jgi:8-oxo-dGTP pyrophosphatase MutT (NUDIX family)
MSGKFDARVIEAAGGIVERRASHDLVIAVIYRRRYGNEWTLPKGKRQIDESWQETARREVEEEIGLNPVIVGLAGATTYLAEGIPKLVLYWRMRVGDDISKFTPNDEVSDIAWLTPARALERLTHQQEADLVRRVFQC